MSVTSDYPTLNRWFRQWLAGQPHQVIGGLDDPYLRRWYVIPRNPWLNIYVHQFLRSDDDRALHDHPWWFVSMLIKGTYLEYTDKPLNPKASRRLFSVIYRPATWRHRVALVSGFNADGTYGPQPCWTLIVTGRRSREWGFWCKRRDQFLQRRAGDRFVPWQQFDDAGCGER